MKWAIDFYSETVYSEFMQWPNKIKERFLRFVELMKEKGAKL